MHGLVSVLLLVALLQPLVGVALCQGLASTEASLMEDGCPMPEATPHRVSQPVPDRPSGSTLTSAGSLHDCVFAEACLNAPPALVSAKLAVQSGPAPHDQILRAANSLHGSEDLPPPIPPPNS